MKDEHLTLRLPRDLARALARWSREHGVPKSQAVREAVARYCLPAALETVTPETASVTAAAFVARWAALPRLADDEATAFEADIDAARRELPGAPDTWE
jgi:hypothetical protein